MERSPVRADVIRCPQPDAVKMKGLVGRRLDASRLNRLRHQEEYHLLWPFQEHCPVGWRWHDAPHPEITRGDWQGEFIGTWIDAACLSAWYAEDDELRQKIDRLLLEWLATQDEDGYLGTYDEEDRWKSWDVWIQAHAMIGLLSYYRYTGSGETLSAAARVADRVLQDFGPGRRHLHTGPHGGMASAVILEPLIWLYWETGDERYLEWGRWLVDEDWEAEGGPAVVRSLQNGRGVAGTANGKAGEMLIDLAGLAELYRATGNERYLEPILIAWEDIVRHHLYITGSASTGECFQVDYVLRNDGQFRLGETCVTMTWLYLNLSLGRLTGEARFFDMVEQALYNHLLGAQSPDGRGWAYYMGLRDSKRYRWHTDPDCCPKRGSRALAQMPQHVFGIADDGLAVNFYEPSEASLALPSGIGVGMALEGNYPFDGNIRLTISPRKASRFKVRLRVPGWCRDWTLRINGVAQDAQPDAKGYLVSHRVWEPGDLLELELEMPARAVVDRLGNNGRVALMRGPLVYAADSSYLPHAPADVREWWLDEAAEPMVVSDSDLPGVRLLDDVILQLKDAHPVDAARVVKDADTGSIHLLVPAVVVRPERGRLVWKEPERYHELLACAGSRTIVDLVLVPFFEAGNRDPGNYRDGVWPNTEPATRVTYQVWLPYMCA